MARKTFGTNTYFFTHKKKRQVVHSKNRHTNQKHGKYYTGTNYRGQGRGD